MMSYWDNALFVDYCDWDNAAIAESMDSHINI